MGLIAVVLLMLASFCGVCDLFPHVRPDNGLRECRRNLSLTALEVLPGGGWDNLRNMDMGRVMNLSYSQCQTTEDGTYFIPDEVFVIPQKISGVETSSEIIDSWLDHQSSTAQSINSDASFITTLNAKFSVENQRVKIHQIEDNSVTTRVQVRNHLYTVKAYPDFTVDIRFAEQVQEIADAIENNQTRRATYLSEKLVLDYGTHVLTSIDVGATLVQEDYLRATYVYSSETDKFNITASAGLNFFDKVKFDIGSKESKETSEIRSYRSNITYSLIQSHGGALFYPGISLQKWQESTLNNLVAIDRAGLPIHYFLNPLMFPELPVPTLRKLAHRVSKAVELYYKINSRPGCVDPTSQNFNFQANIDDGSCDGPATNLSFGGVYQNCTMQTSDAGPICQELAQENPDTGSFSCREPYIPTLLRSEKREEGYTQYECSRSCHSCWIFFDCCDEVCGDFYHVRRAVINTYWCSTNQKTAKFSGYLFGGLYGPTLQNPFTKTRSCPLNFFPRKFLSDGLMICLSNEYETAVGQAFGGFFSCEAGNPMAGGQAHCPPQFSQHLAEISDGCQVLFCVKSNAFSESKLLPIHLPPFKRASLINMLTTNTVAVLTEGDQAWVRVAGTKMWKLATPEEIGHLEKTLKGVGPQISVGGRIGIAITVIVVTTLVIVWIVWGIKKKRRLSGFRANSGYEEIHGRAEVRQQENLDESPTQPLLA
ncbi:macrophage-expressed gene 1 protein-like [Chanos chanos]|uniref:Macrophage-expressed gene 1 protein n=1 Tax=Chanos chanos TaxID=29144 RepID=A0A6J2ULQ2_CHACN|nr:macrophage-expressed gene 1 protein-like [Chanos chanos]